MRLLFVVILAFLLVSPALGQKKKKKLETGVHQAYTETIPGTQLSFRMVPIPAGKFLMGSPASEPNRRDDEGPQHEVHIEPFWMSEFEITWDLYDAFVNKETNGSMNPEFVKGAFAGNKLVDAVALPSQPYVDMSFGMGKRGFPAINMTQYAALAFCQWLTAQTGHFYRLPTEAEWEYACRAGSTTAYHFGDDVSKLGEYAWFYDNSNGAYHPVGQKKPNAWGLYDMHGNVAEWVLDQYVPDAYAKKGTQPYLPAEQLYPIVVRGGSWDDDPDRLRSAARRGSAPEWKQRDPQIPKSKWWFTDASFVGFRIVRPLRQPSKEEIQQYFKTPPADL
ncbi:MAG: SUMF1/EgtB/PvdO family nonheme iron enzyme [Cytophagales bacterium]|nr:formylglycine-generating enzyme family protein [Bernardetiaceae bacterium]MDW8204910.1 SUMF1/EgtB/PvdO family nonheme iron enzyme [Cytophagales bacterium]